MPEITSFLILLLFSIFCMRNHVEEVFAIGFWIQKKTISD